MDSGNDDEEEFDFEDIVDEDWLDGNPFGHIMRTAFDSTFGEDLSHDYDESTKIAVKMIKASDAVHQLANWLEDNDVDLNDYQSPRAMMDADQDMFTIISAMSIYGNAADRLADVIEDDEDDENPFRVK